MKKSFGYVGGLACVLFLAASSAVHAEVPKFLAYQGFLTDSVGNPVTGEWTITFSFFDKESGGEPFYEETLNVTVDMGLFSVYLGTDVDNPLTAEMFAGGNAWLELTIESDVGPIVLEPRQRVASNPYALFSQGAISCKQADDAGSLGGMEAASYVTLTQLPDLCISPQDLPTVLESLGYVPGGGYSDADVAAYLAANGYNPCECFGPLDVEALLPELGYVPGPHFSGKYEDLTGAPDLSAFLTKADAIDFLAASGAVLMADGTVALNGDLDFAGFQAANLVVHSSKSPPEDPKAGQLWWDTEGLVLRVFDGELWALVGGGLATDVDCEECVQEADVAFPFAASDTKSGAALDALDLHCDGCVGPSEVSFSWAKGTLPGGDAMHSLTSDSATNALTADLAQNVACQGCVDIADINPSTMDAKYISYDSKISNLGVNTVQKAIDALAQTSGAGFQEGNGTIVPYSQQWGLPAYGRAVNYIHLMNPAQPKVVMHLYASESSSFATSNNLVVAHGHAPNKYSEVTSGKKGEKAIQVSKPSIFTYGNHVLLHQTVGTGGNGQGAGNWEINQVVGVNGNTILLAKPLEHDYSSGGCNAGRAQAVIAASYNVLEVVSGGTIYPSESFASNGSRGGIVFIRARKIIVKSGGKIHANGYGFDGGNDYKSYSGEQGWSECHVCDNSTSYYGTSNNCSGGGGGGNSYWTPCRGGGGGGGNKTAGGNGSGGSDPGKGGSSKGDADLSTLQFGGGGGEGYTGYGGNGGGLLVLGAEMIVVEPGGVISANGEKGGNDTSGSYCGGGGGAGGTVALFANEVVNNGTIEAVGGKGGDGGKYDGGDGGEGWVVHKQPIGGVVNESYPKGVEIWVDGKEVTPVIGDPNGKGAPSWDDEKKKWGADGLAPWSTGPLDLTMATNWTLGEHSIELKETGGVGGELKMYTYVIYPFSKSTPPANDTCDAPQFLDLSKPVTVSGTTEDVMGKIKATDANQGPLCGGSLGPDVVYAFVLDDWKQISVQVDAAFTPRTYVKKGKCADGEIVVCGEASWTSGVLEPGTYYLFVDGDGNLQKGDFTLHVTTAPPGPPANDTCAGPTMLVFQNGVAKVNDMSLFATDNYKAACGGDGASDLVYQFEVPPGVKSLTVEVTGDFDPVLYLTKDNCLNNPIVCVPEGSYTMGWPTAGTYFLFVDGKTAKDKGLFSLTVTLK